MGIAQSVHSTALARDITLVAQPVMLSDTPSAIRTPPPELGEQSDEILGEAGFSAVEIDGFRRNGTI